MFVPHVVFQLLKTNEINVKQNFYDMHFNEGLLVYSFQQFEVFYQPMIALTAISSIISLVNGLVFRAENSANGF